MTMGHMLKCHCSDKDLKFHSCDGKAGEVVERRKQEVQRGGGCSLSQF